MPAAGWLHKPRNQVNLPSTRAGTAYQVKLMAAGNAAASGTVLSIGLKTVNAAIHKTAKPRHLDVESWGPLIDGGMRGAAMQTQIAGKRLPVVAATSSGNSGLAPVAARHRLMYLGFSGVQVSDRPLATWSRRDSQPGDT